MRLKAFHVVRAVTLTLLTLCTAHTTLAQQLNEHCTISVLNRNVRVRPDGSWVLPNIPANFGLVRARVTCIVDGQTISGESEPFLVPANRAVNVPHIVFGKKTPIPAFVSIAADPATLTEIGATAQLAVTAHYADGSTKDVTAASTGTQYTASNTAIATISGDGLVRALKGGIVLIQATHEGASGIASIRIAPAGVDTDGDGIPDDYEVAHGLNPNNAVDAQEDPDHDGLTNLREYQLGTDPRNPDTDGDGLKDGDEVNTYHTNPLLVDTDGDGISDGLEVRVGTDPLNGSSFNLPAVLSSIQVTPAAFVLTFNTIAGEASVQLRAMGTMLDGRKIDVTARGVNYASSDLNVCNFGATPGQVFAGVTGPCTITATIAALSGTSLGTIRTFSPTPLSFVSIPGFANSVDVSGDFAYVAAGSAGLEIVNVSNHASPHIVASLGLPGNANDVKLDGTRAYVAAGSAGLHIVDISDPLSPRLLGSADTPGEAFDVRASGNLAFVADGPRGLQIIDVSTPDHPRIIGSLAVPGGVAHGVDVNGRTAVIAAGFAGLKVVDVTNPAAPRILGGVALPDDAKDVVLNGSIAYVADYQASLQIVDLTDPLAPRVVGSTPTSLGGILMDVTTSPPFVFGADVFFVNGVPIVDATVPGSPAPRAILDFRNFRDDNGTGIAVDGSYVYLTAARGIVENGVSEDTRLYIGQYRGLEDLKGVAPTVSLTSPAVNTTFIEGETIPLSATATDDMAVVAVTFLVDGVVAFTDTSAPYQFSVKAPAGVSSLTLSANAVDLGANVGVSTDVRVNVIPDPLTTVIGRVVDKEGQAVGGATVSVAAHTGVTDPDGRFTITGVPTLQPVLVVSASLTRDTTILTGLSTPAAPVRGATTDVGDIVVAGTTFETSLGTLTPRPCDFCDVNVTLPFPFTIGSNTYTHIHINNGYLWTDPGDSIEVFCCSLTSGGGGESGMVTSSTVGGGGGGSAPGLYVNDQLPGRFVVTWFKQNGFFGGPPNTVQIILFADGRIQFGYDGVAPQAEAQVGLFPAQRSIDTEVDFSASTLLTAGPGEGVFENFFQFGNPFDLDGGFVVFTPGAGGGYDIRPVPDTTPPTCTITSPADGSTLFEGEPIQVEANATDNGLVRHVTLKSTAGGLDADVIGPPFIADFVVPVGATQITFNGKAFDAWGNTGACTSTVNVISGPPPTVTIMSPAADAVLIEGSTIEVTVDATNRVPVNSVSLLVNGTALSTDTGAPFELLFTVPAGVTSLAMSASATNTVGKTAVSPLVNVTVAPDPRTTVQGRVVDRLTSPVSGAQVTADVHGASLEVFNLSTPLTDWPPSVAGRTPDRVSIVSSVNLRNPNAMFGADPFGLGGSGGHITRFTANVQTISANTYIFKLGVNERGLLRVNGATVVDIPTSTGQFQEASATVVVPLGAVVIEILAVDSGNLEVQLSYALPGEELEVIPLDELTPTFSPYQTTTTASGTFSFAGFPTVLGDVVGHGSAVIDGRTARGRSVQTPPVPAGTTDLGDIRLSGGKVALIHCDSTGAIRDGLASTGLIALEDLTDISACGTAPTLDELSGFGGVLVWSNSQFGQPQALGDVLANFVDQGGGVVLATYSFSSIWRITGRITTDGYSPFSVFDGNVTTSGRLDLANSNTNHPLLDGVTATQNAYFTNFNYTNPSLTPGATLVAVDTDGNNVVAVSASNRVVGVSIFPGFPVPAEINRLFANALNFVR